MGILVIAALIIAIIAIRRAGDAVDLRRRLSALEYEVAGLRRWLESTHTRPAEGDEPKHAEPLPPTVLPLPSETLPPRAGASPSRPTPARPETVAPPDEPPPAPSSSAPPPAPPSLRLPAVDWERWVGIQGAAALGGVVLALAGLLFFRYSIEHGLIPPMLRVVLATLVGLACIVAPERPWRKHYVDAANALAGAGIVILYAAFWAARNLYGLVDLGVAFTLMALVTAAGCLLAVRHASLLIAMLGLVGGFATPFLLSTGADRPIGLFAYILLLDVALLVVARRRGWPILALVSLVATALYQAFWIGTRMTAAGSMLGLVILGVFGVLFAATARASSAQDDRGHWRLTQAGGLLVPFAFGLYFAGNARLGSHLYPVAMLLALLSAAAGWIGREQNRNWLGVGAAAGNLAVFSVWIVGRSLTAGLVWESVACGLVLAMVFHFFVEGDRARADTDGPAPAAMVSAVGFLLLEVVAAAITPSVPPWPWIAGWLGLAGLLLRQGGFPGRYRLQEVAGGGVAIGLVILHLAHASEATFPSFPLFLGATIAVAFGFQMMAMARVARPPHRAAEQASALLALIVLLSLATVPDRLPVSPALLLVGTLVLGGLAALAATRLGSGEWYFAAMAATAVVQFIWTWNEPRLAHDAGVALAGLALETAAVVLFTVWPFLTIPSFRVARWAWYASALAAPAWFPSLKRIFEIRFGDAAIGLLPLALGALALAAAARARDVWPREAPMRRSALAWFAAVALGFLSVAIPLQLEKEWVTIGWALEVFALALLWQRLDHPGLKYFALALGALVTVRLVGNDAVLGYYPRPAWRIVNWLLYTYLVPAAALLGAARVFASTELARLRPWEANRLAARGVAPVSTILGIAAIVVIFIWINLAIADWFATGDRIVLSFQRVPARDLATSIAWAIYALVLLTAGVVWASTGLRWLSLGFLVLTIGKVFLYDLGELRDLYRVLSLLGLAVSLILVSVAYQRFVFRNVPAEEK